MKNDLAAGMSCICIGRNPWKHEFFGIVQKIMSKSVIVIIMITDTEDDYLVDRYGGKTVISKKNISSKTDSFKLER